MGEIIGGNTMKLLGLAVAAATALISTSAMAQVYGSVGYSVLDPTDLDAKLGAITGRIGMHFNPYIGGELEALAGVKDDTATVSSVDVKVKLNSEEGVYVVGFWPINDNFELLGRVGVVTGKATASAGSVSVSDSGSGAAYGVGAQYFFTAHNGVRVDYTRDEGLGDNIWSIAYAFRFK